MIGVNVDNLNTLIKKNNNNLDSFNQNAKKLISNINELDKYYSGKELEYLFIGLKDQANSLKTISSVLENYSDVLLSVGKSYQQQDLSFKSQIDRIDSQVQ